MSAKFFDRFWPYPEILGQLLLVVSEEEKRSVLKDMIVSGDLEKIEEWIAKSKPKDIVQRLLRLGIPEQAHFHTPLFDEILIGTRSFADGAGTVDYILSRRVGSKFLHRVYNDGGGTVECEFETDKPMTKREFRGLTRYPAPWEEPGFEDEVADCRIDSIWAR